jgi:hypothetical protein
MALGDTAQRGLRATVGSRVVHDEDVERRIRLCVERDETVLEPAPPVVRDDYRQNARGRLCLALDARRCPSGHGHDEVVSSAEPLVLGPSSEERRCARRASPVRSSNGGYPLAGRRAHGIAPLDFGP